jgi:protein-S-isoprenylcysteine O-methyltransferase Ste14
MTDAADVERAERLGRRRAWLFAVQALLFFFWQFLFFSGQAEDGLHKVSGARLSSWLVWTMLLLVLLATGGGLLRHRKLRALLDDELTRSHRTRAYVNGFWAAMAGAIAVYIFEMLHPFSSREAVHIIVSAGLGTGLLTFAFLQRGSARAG